MKTINKLMLITLMASTVSTSILPLESTDAAANLGSALLNDTKYGMQRTMAAATIARDSIVSGSKSAYAALQSAGNRAVSMAYATKDAAVAAHAQAEGTTVSAGQWIANNPNVTMAVLATTILGYAIYKAHNIYKTYKKGEIALKFAEAKAAAEKHYKALIG